MNGGARSGSSSDFRSATDGGGGRDREATPERPPPRFGRRLDPRLGFVETLGALLLVRPRRDATPESELERALGERERRLLAEMPWQHRRREWLSGRGAAKALLASAPREWLGLASVPGERAEDLDATRVEILPRASGAPSLHVDGVERASCELSLSHTRRYVAVGLARGAPLGIDVCDLADAPRVARSSRRVFAAGEAERCEVGDDAWRQVAAWAIKEAVLKLDQGGVFVPGLGSVLLESLEPPRLATPGVQLELLVLPDAVVAIARRLGIP